MASQHKGTIMKKLTFGQSKTGAEKVAMASAKGYDTGKKSTGSRPAPKATVKIKPMGGLKPSGLRVKYEKKF